MQVEIWSDVVCPWCYVGAARFAKALAVFEHRAGVRVVHCSYELDPEASTAGVDVLTMLAEKYGVSREQAASMEAGVAEAAHGEGLPYVAGSADAPGRRHGSTRDVHRLLHLAGDLGVRADLTTALMRAHFGGEAAALGEGGIFDREVLLELVGRHGVPRRRAEEVLDSEAYLVDVRADQQLARDLGITAVPTFVLNRRFGVSGAQPPEALLQALEKAWRLPEC